MLETKTISAGEYAYHVDHLKRYRIARENYYRAFDKSRELAKGYPSVQVHELEHGAIGFTANTLRGCIDMVDLRIDIELMLPPGMQVVMKGHGFLVMFKGQFLGDHPKIPVPVVTDWLSKTGEAAHVN